MKILLSTSPVEKLEAFKNTGDKVIFCLRIRRRFGGSMKAGAESGNLEGGR